MASGSPSSPIKMAPGPSSSAAKMASGSSSSAAKMTSGSSSSAAKMASGSPSPAPSAPAPFKWTAELTAELLESVIMDKNSDGVAKVLQVDHKSFFAPLKIFTCYNQFCKRVFKGHPPKECTIEEFERKLLEVLPSNLCDYGYGKRALF